MIKANEIKNPCSCLSKARNNEMLFLLLARDLAAPATIEAWIAERIRLGLNKEGDSKILEARQAAAFMRSQQTNGIAFENEFDAITADLGGEG